MRVVKGNSAFDKPREEVLKYFSRGDLFFCSDIHLCFVCGAGEDEPGSLRNQFIEHVVNSDDTRLVCVKAEEASIELLRQIEERVKTKSLSIFEKAIAETSDSILVFPESAGSIAELGFFSAFDEISQKTLVALAPTHQNDSFINLGPIKHIGSISVYSPLPIIISDNAINTFQQIVVRLLGGKSEIRPYRNRFQIKEFKQYTFRQMLSILDEIIAVIGMITEPDLTNIIQTVFAKYDISQIRLLLSILCATGRVVRNENGDLACIQEGRVQEFIACDSEARARVIAVWADAYRKNLPEALEEMELLQP